MTHTLHRRTETFGEDFILMVLAAHGINMEGASKKLRQIFRLISDMNPDNIANDCFSRCMGYTDEEILGGVKDALSITSAFSDRTHFKNALKKVKEADLGLSVVVSGNYKAVFDIAKELGIKPHTVNMSLGIFGNKSLLPKENILSLCTMCGHGMVSKQRIENTIEEVKSGKLTPEKAGEKLASTCTCGIFNPKLATLVLKNIRRSGRYDS